MSSNLRLRLVSVCALGLIMASALAGCGVQANTPPVQAPPPEPVNNAPIITGLQADAQVVQPLGRSNIACVASDRDGDVLAYRWTASAGTIDGSEAAITWTAPKDPGSYKVTVVVNDGKGGAATAYATITVPEKPNNPPVISAIKFTPEGRGTVIVKPNPTDEERKKYPPIAVKYTTAVVECVASDIDNDGLSYTWKATGGKIIGAGPKIQWLAAGDPGSYTITCDVSDNKGGTSSLTMSVTVKCCGG
jgi:hypothetical protein